MGNASCFKRVTSHLIPSLIDGFLHGDLVSNRRVTRIAQVRILYGGVLWEHEFHFDLDQSTYETLKKYDVFFYERRDHFAIAPGDDTWTIFYTPHQPFETQMEMQAFLLFLWVYNLWIVPTMIAELVALQLSPLEGIEANDMNLFFAHCVQNDLNIHNYDEFLDLANDLEVQSFVNDVADGFSSVYDCCEACNHLPFLFELFLRASWADKHRKQFIDDELFRTLHLRKENWDVEAVLFNPAMQYAMNGDDATEFGGCDEEGYVTVSQKYHFKIMEMFKIRVFDPFSEWVTGEKVKRRDFWENNLKIYFDGSFK